MVKLIAKVPILHGVNSYQPGDILPEVSQELVEAWKRAGSCEELTEAPEEEKQIVKKKEARRVSAPEM